MAAVILVISVVFIKDALAVYSDMGAQKQDLETIDELNKILTENKDRIRSTSSYSDAMAVIEENGIEFSFSSKNPVIFYYDSGKRFSTRYDLSWWFNTYEVTYKNSRIDFYDCTEEIVYTFCGNKRHADMHLVSTKLETEELKEKIGDKKIKLSLSSYEFAAVSYLMTNSVFYDGEMYSYSLDGKTLVRRDVENIRDIRYFGYDLVIAENVTNIPSDIFDGSYIRRIQMSDKTIAIASAAFKDCAYLEKVDLSENISIVSSEAFSGCISLCEMKFGNRLEEIKEGAFSGCVGLSRLYLPESLKNVAENAFFNCLNISVVNYAGSKDNYKALGLRSNIPSHYDQVVRYDDNAYNGGWVYVIRDKERMTFETGGYIGCTYGTVYLADEYVSNEKTYSNVGIRNEAFAYDFFVKLFDIQGVITKIGEKAFYHTGIERAFIPAEVEEIGVGAYSGCHNLKSIDVAEENEKYFSYDGVLFEISGDQAYLLCFPSGYEGDYKIPTIAMKGNDKYVVAGVRRFAFSFAARLSSVSVPKSVEVEDGAFDDYFGGVIIR